MELTERREQLSKEARAAIHKAHVCTQQMKLERLLADSGLSNDAKARIRAAFPDSDLGGLKQAINTEKRGAR